MRNEHNDTNIIDWLIIDLEGDCLSLQENLEPNYFINTISKVPLSIVCSARVCVCVCVCVCVFMREYVCKLLC